VRLGSLFSRPGEHHLAGLVFKDKKHMTTDAEPTELDSLEVTMVDVSSLIEDVDNANTHPQRSLDVICDSLKRFGQVEPLIVRQGTNVVIGGNGRLRAMRQLGWARCAVHYFDGSDHEAKALALVLNRSAQFAEWDKDMLESQLTDLRDVGFDLPELGFNDDELCSWLQVGKQPNVVVKEIVARIHYVSLASC
jgi:hypothetical protein